MRFISESLSLWGIALVLGLLTALLHPNAPSLDVPRDPLAISGAEVNAFEQPLLWIDARSREQFDSDQLPEAILLNEAEWGELFGAFLLNHYEPDTTFIVYCDGEGCDASKGVAQRLLRELPGIHVRFLEGGIDAWEESSSEQ